MKNSPSKFDFGRFKLESYFLFSEEYGICTLVLNETYLKIIKIDVNIKDIAGYIENELQKGNSISVFFNSQVYDLRIEDKKWVYMEKKSE